MRKLLLVLLLLTLPVFAQVAPYSALKSHTFTSATSDSAVRLIGSATSFNKVTWNKVGTVTVCQVLIEQSVDSVVWTTLISAQTCTSNGVSTVVAGTPNYVRITVSSFTGTGSVTVIYTGYMNDPTSGGTGTVTQVNTTAPITGGPINTTGTVACDVASGAQPGCLSSADWTTFNSKQAALGTAPAGNYAGNNYGSRTFNGFQTGVNENTLISAPNAVYNNLTNFTLAGWVYLSSLGSSTFPAFLTKDPAGSYGTFTFVDSTNNIEGGVVYSGTDASSKSSTTFSLGSWHHLAYTFNEATDRKVHIYLDGTEVSYSSQVASTGTLTDNSGAGWYIGNDTFDDGWDGSIAEVGIWNTSLTAGQITTLATAGTPVSGVLPGNVVAYWPLRGVASPEPDLASSPHTMALSATAPTKGPVSPSTQGATSAFSTVDELGSPIISGSIPYYNGAIAFGLAAIRAVDDHTSTVTGNLSSTHLYTPTTSGSVLVSIYVVCNASVLTSTFVVNLTFTDDVQAQTLSGPLVSCAVSGTNQSNTFSIRAKTATAIAYSTTTVNSPKYLIFARVVQQ